ncbi:hypothetical protein BDP27DRAFT_1216302 [Rhodocollybia butyracea]|uniref:GAR domain-containing protein n=1 Tax=Rhodocollybia butyracea TaxID=206335 RepID=A0A9P5Q360_9AGAR|nr:hypothetical protein BDP27DRAFT_1216302 [Rhodocollybia butyracea]
MTELSYMISDIQTRIFEIQELRHKSQSTGDAGDAGTTNIIDQSLMSLDEKLENVSKGIKSVNDSLDPFLQATPTPHNDHGDSETAAIIRKHATLVSEWESVQEESDVLREELKEDKWLTVFRTVTDQADGMMSSLEKGVNRCQEFIWQVHRRGIEDTMGHSTTSLIRPDKAPTLETFNSLLDSFEAKKKHYMPATSKVLAIIDKGVRDRVTKNGETLRRHAESAQRWKTLRDRIARTDADMETVRHILIHGDTGSDHGSAGTTSTQNGYLATPPSGTRGSGSRASSASTISRSISPFRKLARKLTGSARSPISPVTPLSINKVNASGARTPSSEPTLRRQKTSLFTSLRGGPTTPMTPARPSHKYSQSLTPDSSPQHPRVDLTLKGSSKPSNKQPWNSSTKVERPEATIKGTPPKRSPSATGMYGDVYATMNSNGTNRRSFSRASMASSRPWSPVTSSISTNQSQSSTYPPLPSFLPPSRAQTPSRSRVPSRAGARTPSGIPLPNSTPRPRPKTPSHIPVPISITGKSDAGWDDDDESLSMSTRAFSPTLSTISAPGGVPPRPPSRSMIPVPTFQLSSPSRPGSSMSIRARSESPSLALNFKSYALRSQTPESTLKARAQQVPVYQGSSQGTLGRSSARPSLPPSSFREGSAPSTNRAPSRSGSRAGMHTPSGGLPLHEYVPGNLKDPLDVEVAFIANSIAHGLLIERVDPPMPPKKVIGENEEVKAQYAFSNALSRKVITCKLTTLTRLSKAGSGGSGTMTTKKVMCRVGGGWQDLSHYILNRQAGM